MTDQEIIDHVQRSIKNNGSLKKCDAIKNENQLQEEKRMNRKKLERLIKKIEKARSINREDIRKLVHD